VVVVVVLDVGVVVVVDVVLDVDVVVVVLEAVVVDVVELGAGAGADVTAAVEFEVATAEPLLFEAMTTTRSVSAASAVTGAYVAAVAPASAPQLPPLESQFCHW
jgi:hypothetical protein